MSAGMEFGLVLGVPLIGAALSILLRPPRLVLGVLAAIIGVEILCAGALIWPIVAGVQAQVAWSWFYLDALSAYHLAVMMIIFGLSTVFAGGYFGEEIRRKEIQDWPVRKFAALWCGSLAAMVLVVISNNLGVMWIGIEATTLMTAFLICVHRTRASLEAMWKYLLMCSVGVACAFMGTLLVVASARGIEAGAVHVLLWTQLRDAAPGLNQPVLKLAFIFLLIGYGTKAGLAPMHNWLPDAHSQAPAPVSGMFSGFLLNTALYCIMRYTAILEVATGGSGWSLQILQVFGMLSIGVAAVFILFQEDVKRLLAYHSVEHLGIMALGLGLGGLGAFAALFHVFNHSICKALAFFSAGRMGQIYGTHEMDRMQGMLRVNPVWGLGLLGSLLALIGMAPFALFMSEFQIAMAAMNRSAYVALIVFLAGTGIIFVGALKHAIAMAWGEPKIPVRASAAGWTDILIVAGSLGVLLAVGIWMPECYRNLLWRAAAIAEGKP
ncbi:MAG: hydrogenase 4 subunit F [Verrucomicrobia bacterium]|nr:hydrogenase 4 subunit F [Verrucomicrobiota bacterium]MBU4247643.1 hydrogenase 4 subunit F [Verrucomicrobiota bacterium]MBU4292415.1 hydrogenase 4 subunit F [Verrucomicrobiota bacterium]MBU4428402.1 hydrogenase 4 subunit F [Verrucomicrobiota bacterium]MCG2680908.1 hydrogenase 4 subunit F [Kiritimatiellia bacterium]